MKGEDEVGPAGSGERFVGPCLSLERPTKALESRENATGVRGRPVGHGRMLRGAEGNADEIRTCLGMLETISQDSKGKRFRPRDRLITRLSIGKHPWKVWNVGDPPTILFALGFHGEMHRPNILPSADAC